MYKFDDPKTMYDDVEHVVRNSGDLGFTYHKEEYKGRYLPVDELFRGLINRFLRSRGEKPHAALRNDPEAQAAEQRHQWLSSHIMSLDFFIRTKNSAVLLADLKHIETEEAARELMAQYTAELDVLKQTDAKERAHRAHEAR